MCLDARFLSLNDDDSVTTWTSRTGNNDVTQSTSTLKAKFKTAIRGGQPVVRFTGGVSTQNYYENSSFVLSQPFFATATFKSETTPTGQYIFDATSNSSRVAFGHDPTAFDNGELFIYGGGAGIVTENFNSLGTWHICSGLYDSSNSFLYRTGNQVASGSTGSNSFATLRLGQFSINTTNTDTRFNGDMAQVTIYSGTNQSLRKRLEHASAFSFKIACN